MLMLGKSPNGKGFVKLLYSVLFVDFDTHTNDYLNF